MIKVFIIIIIIITFILIMKIQNPVKHVRPIFSRK